MARAVNWQFDLPLESEDELRLFVEKAWGVCIPDVEICPDHVTPWRAFVDAYFAKDPMSVWKASRGFGGKSFMLAVLGLTEAATLKCDVNILGGSGEQSENVHQYCQDFWDYGDAPRELLSSDPMKRKTLLAWGNSIKALMASQRSVRGPHVPRLRLDEIDEMDLGIFDAAMGQTMAMAKNGRVIVPAQTVASSTHQNADGTMTEVLRRAIEKGWPIYEWCMRETSAGGGWLLPSEIERKRGEVTATMWAVEYELQEPTPESRAILPEAVEAMFRSELGTWEGRNGEYIEIELPIEEGEYITGADWARKKDWTVIITFRVDCDPAQLVAFERTGRRPWPVMVDRYDERMKRYPGNATHDGTGLGDVVDGYLIGGAEAFIMTGKARTDLLSNYIGAIERGEVISPMVKFMHGEHKYASVEDVYGGGKAHLPDTIAAGALAWQARRIGPPPAGMTVDLETDDYTERKRKDRLWQKYD